MGFTGFRVPVTMTETGVKLVVVLYKLCGTSVVVILWQVSGPDLAAKPLGIPLRPRTCRSRAGKFMSTSPAPSLVGRISRPSSSQINGGWIGQESRGKTRSGTVEVVALHAVTDPIVAVYYLSVLI